MIGRATNTLLTEQRRQIFHISPDQATIVLEDWLAWARRGRLPPFITITEQRVGILAAIEHGLSHARTEPINTQIPLITRRAFGFHSPGPLIALAMLKLAGLCLPRPR